LRVKEGRERHSIKEPSKSCRREKSFFPKKRFIPEGGHLESRTSEHTTLFSWRICCGQKECEVYLPMMERIRSSIRKLKKGVARSAGGKKVEGLGLEREKVKQGKNIHQD